MLSITNLQELLTKHQIADITADYLVFNALCTFGLCSNTEASEQAIISSLNKNDFILPLKWQQAIFAYLWQNISVALANEWEGNCLNHGEALFANTELDSKRREYLCNKKADLNICRIILNLDFTEIDSLPWQLRFINEQEKQQIKQNFPLLAIKANL